MSELSQVFDGLPPSEVLERLWTTVQGIQETKGRMEKEHGALIARQQQVLHLSEEEEIRKAQLESEAHTIRANEEQLKEYLRLRPDISAGLERRMAEEDRKGISNARALHKLGPAGLAIDVTEMGTIACCACGVQTEVNEARVCLDCLKIDITQGLPLTDVVNQCRSCHRYEKDATAYLKVEWESRELLALCVKKMEERLKLKKLRLVDAKFIWTEPHSRRIKVQIWVEKEVFKGAILNQTMVIEYVVGHKQCAECTKSVTPHLWIAKVQVRQRTKHKRTMLYLEQLVLKHKAHSECVNVIDLPDGMDFCFPRVTDAMHFIEWMRAFFPIQIGKENKQYISGDIRNNTAHTKSVFSIEIVSICRDDLVWIPKSTAAQLGGKPQIMWCSKISTGIHLTDPFTLDGVDMAGEQYWKRSEQTRPVSMMTRQDLVEFMVLNVTEIPLEEVKKAGVAGRRLWGMMDNEDQMSTAVKKAWGPHSQNRLAEIEVARLKDLGFKDETIITRSHLGGLLKAGDIVLGYDLSRLANEGDMERYLDKIPYSVVLVRKQQASRSRSWVLRQLHKTVESAGNQPVTKQEDVEAFIEDLQDHQDLQQHIEMYRNPRLAKTAADKELSKLLEGLSLTDEVL